jgi:tetracycline repressor-like protein
MDQLTPEPPARTVHPMSTELGEVSVRVSTRPDPDTIHAGDLLAGHTPHSDVAQLSAWSAVPAERPDAIQNRARVLAAAAELLDSRDPRQIIMSDIAAAVSVSRGTLYRRYPNLASIAVALLDERERVVQEQLLRGDPPLRPGDPLAQRLAAFYAVMIDLLERHAHLVLGAKTGQSRFSVGTYAFWHVHVRTLLIDAAVPDLTSSSTYSLPH